MSMRHVGCVGVYRQERKCSSPATPNARRAVASGSRATWTKEPLFIAERRAERLLESYKCSCCDMPGSVSRSMSCCSITADEASEPPELDPPDDLEKPPRLTSSPLATIVDRSDDDAHRKIAGRPARECALEAIKQIVEIAAIVPFAACAHDIGMTCVMSPCSLLPVSAASL